MSKHLAGFAVKGYKAFAREARVTLAPLTILLGRNNAGKSSLCYAPLFFIHPFRQDAQLPFELRQRGIDFGTNLLDVCFRRQPTGLRGTLFFSGKEGISSISIGAIALAEENYLQVVSELEISQPDRPLVKIEQTMSWEEARRIITEYPELKKLSSEVEILLAQRNSPVRDNRYLGREAVSVGSQGENAPHLLAQAKADGRDDLLHEVNAWFEHLDVRVDVVARGGTFDIVATGPAGEAASLVDSGSGIAQILPLVVALKLWPQPALPRLLIVEQPELHLHPYAHTHVAELLIDFVHRQPAHNLLVETHSDALILRIRRELAAGRLTPNDVRLYFVDEMKDGVGSSVREVQLNDRGTPDWWPERVFAETQKEFHAIRQELARRDREK